MSGLYEDDTPPRPLPENTYEVAVECGNCGAGGGSTRVQAVQIRKGATVKSALLRQPCPECGCASLRRKKGLLR